MKKTSVFSKALSVCLSMLMVLSVGMVGLYPIAEYANAAIEKTEYQGAPVFSLKFNVPESIYLKPGTGEFEYFLTNKLGAAGADANADPVKSFEITAVAPMADSMTLTYALESTGKKPDGSSVSASGLSVNIASSVSGNQSLTNTLTGKALSGYSDAIAGNEYFIKWTLKYKVTTNGVQNEYTQYAYTSIYVPSLQTAGSSLYFKAAPLVGFKPRNSTYSFLTGGHTVSGGNGYASAFTSSDTAALETNKNITKDHLTDATYVAPLVLFTGGNPGNRSDDINDIPSKPFSAGATVPAGNGMFRNGTIKAQANGGVYVNSESYGNGQWYQLADLNATNAPTLNITVDASRFDNYSQIPNLSAGWMEYGAYGIESGNRLRWIAGVNTGVEYNGSTAKGLLTGNDAKEDTIRADRVAVTALDVDTTDERNNYVSLARGLSHLSGPVLDGHNVMMYAFKTVYDGIGSSVSTNAVISGVDFNVKTIDKTNLRNAVYEAYINGYGFKSNSDSDVVSYINAVAAADRVLVSQFATQDDVNAAYNTINSSSGITTTKEKIKSYFKEIVAFDYVSLNVPEAVYLNATSTSALYSYKYVLDQNLTIVPTNVEIGGVQHTMHPASLSANAIKEFSSTVGGNIEFFYNDVDTTKPVTLSCSNGMGATYTALTRQSDGKYTAKLTGGSSSSYSSGYITWYVTYTDKVDGYQKSVTGKTYVYAMPNSVNSTVAAQCFELRRSGSKSNREILNWTTWITGINDIQPLSSYTTKDINDNVSYISPPLTVSSVIPKSGDDTDPDNSDTLDGCYVSGTGNKGYHGYWWTTANNSGGSREFNAKWKAVVYFDRSRVSSTNQLPFFRVGLDIHENWGGNSDGTTKWSLGYYYAGNSINSTNILGTTESSGNNSNRPKGRVFTTTPDITISSFTNTATINFSSVGIARNNGQEAYTTTKVQMDVVPVVKTDLRAAILEAQKKFSEFGIYYNGSSYDSIYYNNNHKAFTDFVNAYENALKAVSRCDTTTGSENTALASAFAVLDNAISNNTPDSSGRPIKKSGVSKQYNVAFVPSNNHLSAIASVSGAQTVFTENYYAKDTIEHTAENYAGYDFLGFIKSKNDFSIPASTVTMNANPTYITDAASYKEYPITAASFGTAADVSYPNTLPSITATDIVYNNIVDTSVYMIGLYQPHNYKVIYSPNTGAGVDITVPRVYGDAYSIAANTYTKQYYVFDGWNTAADGTGKAYAAGAALPLADMPTEDGAELHLYAQWKIDESKLGSVTVNAGAKYEGDLFYIKPGSTQTGSANVTGGITAQIMDGADGISINGTYNKAADTREVTAGIPVCADLVAGHQYTLSFKTTLGAPSSMYTNFYFFQNGSADIRCNVNSASAYSKTADAEGYYTFNYTFTAGNNVGDTTWNASNATGFYKLRLDIDTPNSTAAASGSFSIKELTLTEVGGTDNYSHTTYGLPDTEVILNNVNVAGKTFKGWEADTDHADRIVTDGFGGIAYALTDNNGVVTPVFADKYLTVGYDNLFLIEKFNNSDSANIAADDVHITANEQNATVTVTKDVMNSSEVFSNDDFTADTYKIPVDGNTEYNFSYRVNAGGFGANSARVRLRMWDASGNELFIEDLANGGAYPYGKTSDNKDIVYKCYYPDLSDKPCDDILLEWAMLADSTDEVRHVIYTGAAQDDGYTELYFVTPSNCAYITVGFGSLQGNFVESVFSNIQLHKTAVYDERTGYAYNYKDKHDIEYQATESTVKYGQNVTVASAPLRHGYTFKGWSATEGAASGNVTTLNNVTASSNLWSTWEIKDYTISYVLNGGTNAAGNPTAYRITDNGVTVNAPSKTGYTFTGWTVSVSGTSNDNNLTNKTEIEGTTTLTINKGNYGNLTLTANWEINTVNVIWKNYDGSVLETDNNVPFGTTPSYDGATPTKAYDDNYHYDFAGWEPAIASLTASDVAGTEKVYVAKFTPVEHTYTAKVINKPTCTSDGETEYFCSCGRKYYEYPEATGHTNVEVSRTEATCTTAGVINYECSVCHATSTGSIKINPDAHNYGTWVFDKSTKTHTKTCSRDASHKITETCTFTNEITQQPTCTETGVRTYTCSTCKGTYTETVSEVPHTYDQKNTDAKYLKSAADCEHSAEYYYSCKCGETGTETFTSGSALDHNYGSWVFDKSTKTHTKTCSRDASHKITETCTFTNEITQQPTCTETGVRTYTCSTCKGTYTETVPEVLHTYDQKNTDAKYLKSAADCEHSAEYYYSCKCGEKGTESFLSGESTGHAYGAPVFTWAADNTTCSAARTCANDASHKETKDCAVTSVLTPVTCETDGYTTYTAKVTFDKEYTDTKKADVQGATGHAYGVWTHDNATANAASKHTKVCANDASHTETASCTFTTTTVAATGKDQGYDLHTCSVCGYSYKDNYTDALGYTITWKNGDTTLETDKNVAHGTTPVYNGETPVKTATAEYTYTFTGWSPAVAAATEDVTYTAQFSQTKNKYTVTVKYYYDGTTEEAASSKSVTGDYGEAYEIVSPVIAGYTVSAEKKTGTVTKNESLTVYYTANTDTQYTVNHYQQKADKSGYELVTADTQTLTGTTDAKTAAAAKTYEGFTAKAFTQADIAGDGSTVVSIYYDRNEYTVTWNVGTGATVTGQKTTLTYGETLTFSVAYDEAHNAVLPAVSSTKGTLTETAANTYAVTGINGDVTVNVPTAVNVYTVTVTGDAGVTVSANAAVNYNDSYTLTVTAKEHYTQTAPTATVNGTALALTKGADNTYTAVITGIKEDKNIVVASSVNKNTLTITYKYADGTKAADTYTATVNYNESYSKTSPAIADFTPVTVIGETNVAAAVVSGTMPDSNVTVNVVYKADKNNNGTPDEDEGKVTITYAIGTNGTAVAGEVYEIKVVPGVVYNTDWEPEVKAKTDYVFTGWTGAPATVTADVTITATYKDDKNNNGTPDEDETPWTVTYKYNDQTKTETVLDGLTAKNVPAKAELNAAAPTGKCFKAWDKDVTAVITADITFTAVYAADANGNEIPDDEETALVVTYKYNTETKTENVLPGNKAVSVPTKAELNAAAPTGKCFKAWDKDVTAVITADITFTAVYAADANGNEIPDDEETALVVTYKYNTETKTENVLPGNKAVSVPTKAELNAAAPTGKCFKAWDKDVTAVITADITFTAVYAADANGNDIPDDEETALVVTYKYNTETKTENVLPGNKAVSVPAKAELNAAAPTGKCFKAWDKDVTAVITADITFTAVYAADANGNEIPDDEETALVVTYKYNTETKTENVLPGNKAVSVPTKAELNAAAPTGKCFKAWDKDVTAVITADITFTAVYAADANGNDIPDDEETALVVTYKYNTETKTENVLPGNKAVSVPTKAELNAAAPTGKCFKAWDKDVTAVITADITFTAVYAADANGNDIPDDEETALVVTYKYNTETKTENVLPGNKAVSVPTKAELNAAAPTGKCFKAWDKDVTAVITADITFTAVYAADANGNEIPDDEETALVVTYKYNTETKTENVLPGNKAVSVPAKAELNAAAPTGKCFKAWDKDVTAVITADITFTAVYAADANGNDIPDDEEVHYTVKYVTDGKGTFNTGAATEISVVTGADYDTVWRPAYTANADYIFSAWTNEPAKVTADVTVTLTFAPDFNHDGIDDRTQTYTVTFVDYKDEVIATDSVLYGNSATAPAMSGVQYTDSAKHYVFSGWDKSLNNITGDTTIKAVYTGAAHDKTETVITEATCTATGKKSITCSGCDFTDTGIIPAKGHSEVVDAAVPATCEGTGLTEGKHCSVCNAVLVAQKTVKAIGHKYVGTVLTAATCTEDGEMEYVCANDSTHRYTEVIPALGHNWGAWYVVEMPTDTAPGIKERKCKTCGKTEQAEFSYADEELEIVADGVISTGTSPEIYARRMPSNTVAADVTWTSSNESILFINNEGEFFAIGVGTVTITATTPDGKTVSKTFTVVDNGNARLVRFQNMDKMHFIFADYYFVAKGATVRWAKDQSFRFRVYTYSNFAYKAYIVRANGIELKENADGTYTVPAGEDAVVITIEGAAVDANTGKKLSFWELLIQFFKKIFSIFSKK